MHASPRRLALCCAPALVALLLTAGASARPPRSEENGSEPASWNEGIDRLWTDEGRPTGMCSAYFVRAFPPLLRGSASGRGCLIRAIEAARAGDRKLATGWLRAGLCGSGHGSSHSGAAEALDYALERYGEHAH